MCPCLGEPEGRSVSENPDSRNQMGRLSHAHAGPPFRPKEFMFQCGVGGEQSPILRRGPTLPLNPQVSAFRSGCRSGLGALRGGHSQESSSRHATLRPMSKTSLFV